jgi:RNA polymerase sigma factor (sigma-70 family)
VDELSPDFSKCYRELHPRLVGALAAVTGDIAAAQDNANEAFARALAQWPRVQLMDSPEGWIYRVGMNLAKRHRRREALERRLLARRLPREETLAEVSPFWELVADLPRRQRTAVVLRHVAQMREHEIANVMGVSRGTVSSTLRAAYARLRITLHEPPVEGALPK